LTGDGRRLAHNISASIEDEAVTIQNGKLRSTKEECVTFPKSNNTPSVCWAGKACRDEEPASSRLTIAIAFYSGK